jgi:hypothetical protein
MTYNGNFFDKNSMPRGILHLAGDYATEDLAAFKRYWNAMVRGIQNSHNMPIMVAKDSGSKASYEKIDADFNDMAFGKWLTFLTSVACAIYGISPEEIAMESFAAQKSGLAGSDTEERITSSNDKGLRPLLAYFENTISDYVIRSFSPQYVFRFVGLDADDESQRFEMRKLVLKVDEARALEGFDPWGGPTGLGDAPLNPTLMTAWQAAQQQAGEQEDFGQPPNGDKDAPGGADDKSADGAKADGEPGDQQAGKPDFGKPAGAADFGKRPAGGEDMGKAFGLPDLNIYGLDQ